MVTIGFQRTSPNELFAFVRIGNDSLENVKNKSKTKPKDLSNKKDSLKHNSFSFLENN
jgi:hypothetical protein